MIKHLKESDHCAKVWRGHERLKLWRGFPYLSDEDVILAVLHYIPVGIVVCVCGAEFALANRLSTHVECTAECFEVWKTEYIRDMKLLEHSFSREDGGLEPLPDMIVMGGEDALLPGSLVERAPVSSSGCD
ncbi:hypothetical protein L873DRAFT_1817904 [Choiromyces venosus 120613-1]|uniref:Uncharacterized protein n=1 Tax=Choiromyces venosus 120613-1 TaxID=1336337 RepID=A0A3N4J1M4_9PEZI|nr:hypothetical protein L873DRAFT_1817904 [Choiromyces venosus 120613-1]